MTITISLPKDDLIARLQAQIPIAKKYDEAITANHKQAEKKALDDFRQACREAAKWDYETAKKNHFAARPTDAEGSRYYNGPSCPALLVPQFEGALRAIAMDYRKTYTLTRDGIHGTYFRLLNWTPNPSPETPC